MAEISSEKRASIRGIRPRELRAAAAKALAQDPDPQASPALVEAATGDKNWLVRAAALDAIAHPDDSSLLPNIAIKLNDERDEARFTAAAAIARLSQLKPKKK